MNGNAKLGIICYIWIFFVVLQSMPRIVFFIKNANNSGGMERVLSIISSQLAAKGFGADIISIQGKGGKPFFDFSEKVGIHYLFSKDSAISPYREIRRSIRMKRLYRELKPDIVVMVGSNQGIPAAMANKGIRTVTWEHFNIVMKNSLKLQLLHGIAARISDAIVTLTERDAAEYRRRYGVPNALCIPNPVTLNVSSRQEYASDRRVILNPARICRQKRQDLLLKAWAASDGPKSGWILQIVGQGKRRKIEALQDLAVRLGIEGSVEICRPDKNIAGYYNKAGVVALSSEFEGLPLVLIEAQAMGIPQLSFDCATGPSEIIVDGQTGILARPLDVQSLAKGIDVLISDSSLRMRMSEASLKNAEKYSVDNITQRWIDFLSETACSN